MKSSPPQQEAMVESWTADFLVFGQALYHWAIPPPCCWVSLFLKSVYEFLLNFWELKCLLRHWGVAFFLWAWWEWRCLWVSDEIYVVNNDQWLRGWGEWRSGNTRWVQGLVRKEKSKKENNKLEVTVNKELDEMNWPITGIDWKVERVTNNQCSQ